MAMLVGRKAAAERKKQKELEKQQLRDEPPVPVKRPDPTAAKMKTFYETWTRLLDPPLSDVEGADHQKAVKMSLGEINKMDMKLTGFLERKVDIDGAPKWGRHFYVLDIPFIYQFSDNLEKSKCTDAMMLWKVEMGSTDQPYQPAEPEQGEDAFAWEFTFPYEIQIRCIGENSDLPRNVDPHWHLSAPDFDSVRLWNTILTMVQTKFKDGVLSNVIKSMNASQDRVVITKAFGAWQYCHKENPETPPSSPRQTKGDVAMENTDEKGPRFEASMPDLEQLTTTDEVHLWKDIWHSDVSRWSTEFEQNNKIPKEMKHFCVQNKIPKHHAKAVLEAYAQAVATYRETKV